MTAPATVAPGGTVWAVATRFCPLDPDGNIIPGADVFVTDQLMKATITPVNEAGDAIAIKNAKGNLGVYALKGDIPKWYTVAIEMVYPDPQIEALLTGGTVFNDTSSALGAPDAPTLTGQSAGGSLAAGTYAYETESYTVYGRTTPGPAAEVTTSGSTSQVLVAPAFIGDELGAVVFGRVIGLPLEIGKVPNIGTQTTSAASGTGTVVSLSVDALTKPIPQGTTFTITGDTNTPNIVFTVAETGEVGSVVLGVTALSVTITIAGDVLIPVFVDKGTVVPVGVPNQTDLSGGPGLATGQQSPAPGVVANPNGVSIEFWMENIDEGHQDTTYPYKWFLLGRATYFVVGARDVTNAELQALYTGTAFPNPNCDGGPSGQFPFDSSGLFQWTVCGSDVVPTPSYIPQAAGV